MQAKTNELLGKIRESLDIDLLKEVERHRVELHLELQRGLENISSIHAMRLKKQYDTLTILTKDLKLDTDVLADHVIDGRHATVHVYRRGQGQNRYLELITAAQVVSIPLPRWIGATITTSRTGVDELILSLDTGNRKGLNGKRLTFRHTIGYDHQAIPDLRVALQGMLWTLEDNLLPLVHNHRTYEDHSHFFEELDTLRC